MKETRLSHCIPRESGQINAELYGKAIYNPKGELL